jgi:hypothetical protein
MSGGVRPWAARGGRPTNMSETIMARTLHVVGAVPVPERPLRGPRTGVGGRP